LDGMLGGNGLLPEGHEGRQTQLTGKREGHRMDIMRQARVQRHVSSVLHDLFSISLRLESSPIALEASALQQSHWACEAGVPKPTRGRLEVAFPATARGGDTRVPEETAQSRHCQSAPEPSAVDMPHAVGGLTRPLSQAMQWCCLA